MMVFFFLQKMSNRPYFTLQPIKSEGITPMRGIRNIKCRQITHHTICLCAYPESVAKYLHLDQETVQ